MGKKILFFAILLVGLALISSCAEMSGYRYLNHPPSDYSQEHRGEQNFRDGWAISIGQQH